MTVIVDRRRASTGAEPAAANRKNTKRRASTDAASASNIGKKRSRFLAGLTTPASVPGPASPSPDLALVPPSHLWRGFSKIRRTVVHIFHRLQSPRAQTSDIDTLDGAPAPRHRNTTPSPPALLRFRKIRSETGSSSSLQQPLRPQRKRSVRFKSVSEDQMDGHHTDDSETPIMPEGSGESRASRVSSRISERIAAFEGKLNGRNGTSTVVHRANMRTKPSVPFINTNMPVTPEKAARVNNESPSTVASSVTNSGRKGDWSPVSTVSTAATSMTSPGSSSARPKRTSPEDALNLSKNTAAERDENVLPPIEEDSGRYLMIPVQEAEVDVQPSVATAENVAAAKVYLETHFSELMSNSPSPRSIRRKRFEQVMLDKGLSHNDRVQARDEWSHAETDHLRQSRVLKATSIDRHKIKGISIAGFDVIRILGKGSFGIVRLVTERANVNRHGHPSNGGSADSNTGSVVTSVSNMDGTAKRNLPTGRALADVFAMKVIRKSEMLRACQEGHLRAERDFLVEAEGSRWVVPLIASFQDNTNLYLVMEYMIGGDFLGLLLREDVLEEDVAK
ncbi:hypothetical protein LTR62_000872 [Meristemomyces frigidus]|uniref:non-specific serine/threonine protein kinase n=1 Tax=Meristemomyces frigidus TaxID=1508187 RepID=A0AAN7TGI6_9PEZI|nr:hypothetical protein LTR62_000872 [Meristemomyces frigidus]